MRVDEIIANKSPTFSVEFSPPRTPEEEKALFETARQLSELEPDFVSVTYGAGGSTRDGTVEITRRLKDELGYETMAHLSCVGETTEGLRATLDKIEDAGIENVFALRGDAPRGEGDFVQPEGGLGNAAELISFIEDGRWDLSLGGACFPEVHPEATDLETDLAYLKQKVEAGASFLTTQLFFDNQVYFDFVARGAGDRDRRADHGRRDPGRHLRPDAADLRALRSLDPGAARSGFQGGRAATPTREFELGIAYAAQQCSELLVAGAPGIHFYALNRAPATRAVLGALWASKPWERPAVASSRSPAPSASSIRR